MATESGRLGTDPLFLALTRPAMLFGVTYLWGMLEGGFFCMYFINTNDFGGIFYVAIAHVIGVMLCSYEPRFMDIFKVGLKTMSRCPNRAYHNNTCSYDMY